MTTRKGINIEQYERHHVITLRIWLAKQNRAEKTDDRK